MRLKGAFVNGAVLSLTALLMMGATCEIDQSKTTAPETTDGTDGNDGSDGAESKGIDEVKDGVTTIGGAVLDGQTLQPIQGAIITTDPATATILTNAQGEYVIDVTDFPNLANFTGLSMRISAARDGFLGNSANITVVENQFGRADILLSRAAQEFNVQINPNLIQFSDADFGSGNTATKTVAIQLVNSPGVQSASYSIQIPSQFSWASVNPSTGTITGTPQFLDITVDRKSLQNGAHNASLNVVVTGATQFETIQVKYTRNDGASSSDGGDGGTDGADDSTDGAGDGTDGAEGMDGADAADASGGAEGTDAAFPSDWQAPEGAWYDEESGAWYDADGYEIDEPAFDDAAFHHAQ